MPARDVHPSVKAMRTTQLGIVVSVALVFIKALAGYFGHSYALLADATETGADVFSSSLLLFALRVAHKPADKEHPYGHGKAEPLASIGVSIFLMAAAVWIAWNSVIFIMTPHQLPKPFTLYILVFVIGVKELMFRYVLHVGKTIDSNAVKADAYHHRSDAITSIAALIGVSVAVIYGKGYESADDWAALAASVIIIYNAVVLLRPGFAEIMDAAPSQEIVSRVRRLALTIAAVKAVEKCYVRKMGFDYYVDLHILVEARLTVEDGHRIAHEVKDKILSSNLMVKNVLVHVEPYYSKPEPATASASLSER